MVISTFLEPLTPRSGLFEQLIHSGMPISRGEWLPTLLLQLQRECQFTAFVHDHRLPGHLPYLSVSAVEHHHTAYSWFYWLLRL